MTNAVFFDWSNTVTRYYPLREEAFAKAGRDVGLEVMPARLAQGVLLADQFYSEENTRLPIKKREAKDQIEVYIRYGRVVFEGAGIEVNDDTLLRIMKEVAGTFLKTSFALYDDVLPAFDLLRQRGLVLGLISNIDRDIKPFCEELGLGSYLNFVVTSLEVGSDKPNPPIFLAALERAGVKASEAVYVGDQYSSDIVGARGVGMRALLIDRYDLFGEIKDCPRIRTLVEITKYL